ncbi:MAG TPA: ATP-binding cassette domain-containing protein, partial [Rectinemataceae bacterium]|nr:ATP-binding cassette domain-containing protein [Rectinemataceae bacterium]
MSGPLLSLEGLRIGFRRGGEIREVVHGVDLEVGENETLALVGESGSGKTVTAQSVLRLIPESLVAYTAGRVVFKGRDILR